MSRTIHYAKCPRCGYTFERSNVAALVEKLRRHNGECSRAPLSAVPLLPTTRRSTKRLLAIVSVLAFLLMLGLVFARA